MNKKIFSILFGFIVIFSSSFSLVNAGGLVPKCNTIAAPASEQIINGVKVSTTAGFTDPCDFNYLMTLINNVIKFLLVDMATPIFALILIYAGWLFLSDMGSAENVTKAKKTLKNALIGYVIALAAWLVVKTILAALGFTGETYLSLIINNVYAIRMLV